MSHQQKPTQAMVKASIWYARLASGEASESEIADWRAWAASDPQNLQAWQKLERVTKQFDQVPQEIGLATLQLPPSADRRRIIKHLALFLSASSLGLYAYREQPWREVLADHSTAVGERREIQMADGGRLVLNTDSAVNIHFSSTARTIELIKGEVFIETGHENLAVHRPFMVQSRHGTATALGTKFSVRDVSRLTRVSVFEGAVEVQPNDQGKRSMVLQAGESIEFSATSLSAKTKVKTTEMAWVNGIMVVYAMRLDAFVSEISRYKTGVLRCDPAVGGLLISGSFPLQDMEAVLNTLEETLPVRVDRFTRYWVNIKPA
ncbi:FecR domain-containing protein [Methylobacillus gramineus]|uniref:FecR domain-containing protein n=1 Tax=Methylobacillus gramineus TaxID=755169 RepID=UPI001CFFE3AD|nr:FecR domain-containing protein [Methylobacillus gramineus]MCB5184768.1 FecR domain-containing protein [Methylobacillus gramineus]